MSSEQRNNGGNGIPQADARLSKMPRPPVAILGVPFDNVTLQEAIGRIENMIALRRPHFIVTANVDFIVQARGDVELHRILCDAHMVLCDGTPVKWAARLLGNPLPERVAGADIVPRLIEVAAQKRYRLFLLGATPESSAAAVARLQAQYPDVIIAGHYSPPFKQLLEMDHKEIRRRIRAAKPDLLFVSFGCPKQEKWLAMHCRDLKVPVSIGVGATIDFLAGQMRRAPAWMQRTGTEWLFRLAQEPRRLFRRYLRDLGVFSWCLLRQYLLNRNPKSERSAPQNPLAPFDPATPPRNDTSIASFIDGAPCGPANRDLFHPEPQLVRLPAHLLAANAAEISRLVGDALVEGRDCLLDATRVSAIDSTGMGLLLQFRRDLNALDLKLILVSPSRRLRRLFDWMHLGTIFVVAPDIDTARQQLDARATMPLIPLSLSPGIPQPDFAWRGEVTAANVGPLWDQTRAWLASVPALNRCELDLSAVRFIDSSGLGLMIRAKKLAQAQQKQLVFTNAAPAVRNVVRLARLEDSLFGQKRRERSALNDPVENIRQVC